MRYPMIFSNFLLKLDPASSSNKWKNIYKNKNHMDLPNSSHKIQKNKILMKELNSDSLNSQLNLTLLKWQSFFASKILVKTLNFEKINYNNY